MIYGTPILLTDDDQTDRIGIRSLVVSKLWQPSRDDLSLDERDKERPEAPDAPSGTLLIGAQTVQDGGALRTRWTFEGHNPGSGIPLRDRTNTLDCGFEPGFSQVPIELHKDFARLLEEFGGFYNAYDGVVIWTPTLGGGGSSTSGLSSGTKTVKSNPMFGYSNWLRPEGTYWCRYAQLSRPSESGSGKIAGKLPGNPPAVEDGRSWLSLGVLYRQRGLVFECMEYYWLSGPGGWPLPIYGQAAPEPQAGLTTGGLTTGSL
jgi:hypothetical protein